MALLLGLAVAAQAQVAPPQVVQRQDLMKSSSAAIRTLVRMMRGTQPWDQSAAKQAAATINDNSKRITDLFPPGSGAESGAKTAARPAIWDNLGDFQAKAKALELESEKLLAVTDEASLKERMPEVSKTCSGCHEVYRNAPE